MLEMIFHVGNNIFQGDVNKIIEVHEENSFIDSGLRKEGRKDYSKNKHWKEGWFDEVESKFKRRDIEVINKYQNIELKTKINIDGT